MSRRSLTVSERQGLMGHSLSDNQLRGRALSKLAPTYARVIRRLEGLEGRLELGLLLELLLEVEAKDDVAGLVEDHLALVELGHGAEEVKRAHVPNLWGRI